MDRHQRRNARETSRPKATDVENLNIPVPPVHPPQRAHVRPSAEPVPGLSRSEAQVLQGKSDPPKTAAGQQSTESSKPVESSRKQSTDSNDLDLDEFVDIDLSEPEQGLKV